MPRRLRHRSPLAAQCEALGARKTLGRFEASAFPGQTNKCSMAEVEFWQAVLAMVLVPSVIVGSITFILRSYFQQLLARDLEKYRADLTAKAHEHQLILQGEFEKQLFEFRTRFSLYYQKQADAVAVVHKVIRIAAAEMGVLVGPLREWSGAPEDRVKLTIAAVRKLATVIEENRLYLDEATCQQLDRLFEQFWNTAVADASIKAAGTVGASEAYDAARGVIEIFLAQVPGLLRELEQQFRKALIGESTPSKV